eukprot:1716889-Karenia_brevis.AAC.1
MPSNQQLKQAKEFLSGYFDADYFSSDFSSWHTSDIWKSWNSRITASLHSGLTALAEGLDYSLPEAKAFTTYGKPHVVDVPLFTKLSVDTPAHASSLLPSHSHQLDLLKQVRRLQDLIAHTKKQLSTHTSPCHTHCVHVLSSIQSSMSSTHCIPSNVAHLYDCPYDSSPGFLVSLSVLLKHYQSLHAKSVHDQQTILRQRRKKDLIESPHQKLSYKSISHQALPSLNILKDSQNNFVTDPRRLDSVLQDAWKPVYAAEDIFVVVNESSHTAGGMDGFPWPYQTLHSKAHPLSKDPDSPYSPLAYRFLLLTSILYRIWGKIRLKHLKCWIHSWQLDCMYGGMEGVGAEDAWYTTALEKELSIIENRAFVGGSLDLFKCFDQIIRPLLYVAIPRTLADDLLLTTTGPRALHLFQHCFTLTIRHLMDMGG